MISSELRATVSSGLTRPPTSTGIFPSPLKSKSRVAVLDGSQLGAINIAATARMIHGRKLFMPLPSVVVVKSRRDENQIGQGDRRRQSRTPGKAQRSSGCALPARSSRNRLAESRPDKMSPRDNEADDSYKSKRRGSPSARDQSE